MAVQLQVRAVLVLHNHPAASAAGTYRGGPSAGASARGGERNANATDDRRSTRWDLGGLD